MSRYLDQQEELVLITRSSSPLQPQLCVGRLAEYVQLETDPDERQQQTQATKDQAVKTKTPPEGRDPWTSQLNF